MCGVYLPHCCLNGGYPLSLSTVCCQLVIMVVMKQQRNMSICPQGFTEKWVEMVGLKACLRGGSHFSVATLFSDVVKRHGLP